jgi:DNA-directed RNA polymerase specialized sigma24 family protein
MRQDNGDRDERPGSTPDPFEAFYLREYPQVVGLLHGLLGSRLVAEELAQETFLVAYRIARSLCHPAPPGCDARH